jgi:hypothetical protein
MRWTAHVACWGSGKCKQCYIKKNMGTPHFAPIAFCNRQEDIIKVLKSNVICEGVKWIQPDQHKVQWWDLVNMIMNFIVL